MQLSRQDLINQIEFYKKRITISKSELENFLKYLDQSVFKRSFLFCSPEKASVTKDFERAFDTLSDHQKTDYYLVCLKIVFALSNNENGQEDSDLSYERVELEYREGRKNWKKTMVIISYKQVMLEVQALKLKLKLQNYIFRMSKTKEKPAFVLESTRSDNQPMTLRLGHSNREELINLLIKMKGLAMSGLKKKIAKMIAINRDSNTSSETWFQKKECFSLQISKEVPEERKSLRMMIKARKSAQYQSHNKEQCQEKIMKELFDKQIIQQMDDFLNYQKIQEGFYIHKGKERIRKSYTFPQNFITQEQLIKELTNYSNFKLWKKSLCNISLIGEFPKESTLFFHQINVYKDGNQVDYVYLKNRLIINGITYFIDKSIASAEYGSHETSSSRGKIDYCLWRVRENKDKRIQLCVQAQITHLPCVDIYQAMNEQIGELEDILAKKIPEEKVKKQKSHPMRKNSFFSLDEEDHFTSFDVSNKDDSFEGCSIENLDLSKDSEEHQSFFYSILDLQNEDPVSPEQEKEQRHQLMNLHLTPIKIRKPSRQFYQYQIVPTLFSDHLFKEYVEDKFFNYNQCVPNQNGDLVFTNQKKIKAQGGVLGGVLKRLGANLLSGKSILNVSLPIQIFTDDTNIQRLCRGMAYAPHFLEKKVNASPLQKIKAAICFSLGTLILYIDMAKPFNPILGETYQAFIDGCPIYGEQTSHHPPISSLLMVGREYFISANLEAKVEIGMNSASGTNFGEYHIAFHPSDPTKNQVIFTSPSGQLSGMIIGQRRLNIVNKSRYYDPENNLFCEIRWGKGKSKHPLSKFNDYFEGKIVKLRQIYPNISKIKQNDKDQVLGIINGRWTQGVFFNDEQLFNINTLRPFKVTDEQKLLQSDSRLRQDRIYLSEGKIEEAQTAKEKLEEIQRRDRKLRKC